MKKLLLPIAIAAICTMCLACSDPEIEGGQAETFAREFVQNLTEGNTQAMLEVFDSTMTAAITEPQLEQIQSALTEQFGMYYGQGDTRTDTLAGFDIVFVTMNFESGTIDAKVVLSSAMEVAGLFFLPTPPPKYTPPGYVGDISFTETTVQLGDPQWLLKGTLTEPEDDGPFPAVVLVHGSGPANRDGLLGHIRPFKDLAWGLASRGVVVLRYDKRTAVHGEKFAALPEYTVQHEVIEDVAAACDLLRMTPKVDSKRIFVLGHSLGGMLLPRIDGQAGDLAGLVALAANTRPLEDMIVDQTEYLFGIDGNLSDGESETLLILQAMAAEVKSDSLTVQTPNTRLPMGVAASYWLDLRDYRPAEAAAELETPMLILQGERDYQVTIDDFDAWKSALGDRDNVTFKTYPALNHLFVAGEGPPVPDEYFRPGHVAEEVVSDIANWIAEQ